MKTVLLILVSVVALSFAAYHTVKNLPHRRKQEDKGCREEEVGSPCRSPGKACAESGAAAGKKDDTISYVYSRLENYFITDRPFLDGNLGINDVARRLYTNKAYVSMAIHRFIAHHLGNSFPPGRGKYVAMFWNQLMALMGQI